MFMPKISNQMVFVNGYPLRGEGGGGEISYETAGDARRHAQGCKFWILVSFRVSRAKRQYFMPPRSRLARVPRRNTKLREQKLKSNFLLNFLFRLKHSMIMSLYH